MLQGVRGATTVERNESAQIGDRTRELLRLIVEANGIRSEEVASAIFTVTSDLDAAFPTVAARAIPGWEGVALICSREIPVPGSLGHCIRVLIHWNTEHGQAAVRHVFLRGARALRPEWSMRVPGDEESAPRPLAVP